MKCSIMLHFIWIFNVYQSTHLRVSSIQRVKGKHLGIYDKYQNLENWSLFVSGQGLDSVLVKIGEKLIERFQVPWVENEIISFDNTIKVNANSKRQDSNCGC